MGGHISVMSTEGAGARFVFAIPAVDSPVVETM
jgi:hypothetical protein